MRSIRLLSGFFLTLFMIVALASYSMHDPAWSVLSSSQKMVMNKAGLVGSHVADILYLSLGLLAWGVPLIFLHSVLMDLKKNFQATVILGWSLLILSTCFSVEYFALHPEVNLPIASGGWLGLKLHSSGRWILGEQGSLIGALCLGLSGLSLVLRFSLVQWLEQLVTRQISFSSSVPAMKRQQRSSTQREVQREAASMLSTPVSPPRQAVTEQQQLWQAQGQKLIEKLREYGVHSKITAIIPGPVIVRFEMQLAAGERSGKIVSLAKDLARALKLGHVHVLENIPGKSAIGLEIPTVQREIIPLKPLLEKEHHHTLPLALGVCAQGDPVIVDLAKLPHMLVAGSTGSGKSVGMNAMLLTLITQCSPDQLKLVLIDPKILEFARYKKLSHLACAVLTEPDQAIAALRWCVSMMESRYQVLAKNHVRHISEYHKLQQKNHTLPPMPYLVIVVDELADLMLMTKKTIEEPIARLAQKARACGIHLILATQRPSVDVITGLIKANIPTRLAFAVSSKIDSRTIIDQQGAEHLLGMGDAYLLQSGEHGLKRVHGAYVSDEDCERVLACWKQEEPAYLIEVEQLIRDYLQEE
ncbi:DNA translocase FtsK [bacterium]|nr:DNA translocase FtsK [bacterium]NBX71826.1 DNA translocase FtsK [bacterium]